MALMVGTGPFGRRPAGTFNFTVDAPAHQLYLEPTPRRIRIVVGGEVVADSSRAMLLHETGLMPVYYLPRQDVREELLERSEISTHCPFKGDASYYSFGKHNDVAWSYAEPLEGIEEIEGRVVFYQGVSE
jgi:uncharacterized protein (DUF427 family)